MKPFLPLIAHSPRWEIMLTCLLAAEIILFGIINPRFLGWSSLLYSTSDFVQIGIVALPLTLVIIAGGIDISFSSTIGLCAVMFGVCHYFGLGQFTAVFLALLTGALCGGINAAIVFLSNIQPLVVSLGCLYLFSGLATVLSGAVGGSGYEGIGNFPKEFTDFTGASVAGIPMPLIVMVCEALILGGMLHFTRFGRMIFLTGLSETAAVYSGLPIRWVKTWTYVLTGLGAAIAGLILASYFGSARADLGTPTLLPAITSVALGGVAIYGGKGTIYGTFVATLILGYLQQGLQMSGVSSQTAEALAGALLVVVVCVKQLGGDLRLLMPFLSRAREV